MKLNVAQVQLVAMQILKERTQGIRWNELLKEIEQISPETPHNTVHGATHKLLNNSLEIKRIARGSYRLAEYVQADDAVASAKETEAAAAQVKSETPSGETLTEQDFYGSFAQWLEENHEATFAAALGGSSLGGKWGTPDVIGVLKPRAQDLFKFQPQIITAELKAVAGEPVVAFGQAVAYRLFSHKAYIVVPRQTNDEDMDRLTSLCSIHGVGLITFVLDKDHPDYVVIVPAANAAPDMYYVNIMLDKLKSKQPGLLNQLF